MQYPNPIRMLKHSPVVPIWLSIPHLLHMLRHNLHISRLVLPNSTKGLNSSALELASRYMRIKEHVHLSVRAALGLRNAEVSPDGAESSDTSPEETSLRSPIPRPWVQHVRREHIRNDACNIVEVASEHDSLVPEAGG